MRDLRELCEAPEFALEMQQDIRVRTWMKSISEPGYHRMAVLFLTRTEIYGILKQGAVHNEIIAEYPWLKNNKLQCSMEIFWPESNPADITILPARATHATWFDPDDAVARSREWLLAQPEYQALTDQRVKSTS